MKITMDNLGKMFQASFKGKRILITLVHIIIALLANIVFGYLGAQSGTPAVASALWIVGLLLFLYLLLRAAFINNCMTLAELQGKAPVTYQAARGAFDKAQLQVFLLVGMFVGTVVVEMGIVWLINQISNPLVLRLLLVILLIPFTALGLLVMLLLLLGGGFYLPIMIDRNLGALESVKAMLAAFRQQSIRVLRSQLLVLLILALAAVIVYGLLGVALTIAFGSMVLGNVLSAPGMLLHSLSVPLGGGFLNILYRILLAIDAVVILGGVMSYLFNLSNAAYGLMYLDLKQHGEFTGKAKGKR